MSWLSLTKNNCYNEYSINRINLNELKILGAASKRKVVLLVVPTTKWPGNFMENVSERYNPAFVNVAVASLFDTNHLHKLLSRVSLYREDIPREKVDSGLINSLVSFIVASSEAPRSLSKEVIKNNF